MLPRLLIAVGLIIAVWTAMGYYRKQSKQKQKKLAPQYIFIGICIVVVILGMTGRLNWISGVIAAIAATVVRLLPVAARLAPIIFHFAQQKQSSDQSRKTSSGKNSTVQSEYLKIVLDHDSETMRGEVVNGPHKGNKLSSLSRNQLKELLQHYYQHDNESWQLLNAYVQRQYPDDDWQFQQSSSQHSDQAQKTITAMTRKEALEILGLEDSATKYDINTAHKKLMQRLHPDRGGSTYLAAKVNEAKDYLLKH